jgi:hypothetical protein
VTIRVVLYGLRGVLAGINRAAATIAAVMQRRSSRRCSAPAPRERRSGRCLQASPRIHRQTELRIQTPPSGCRVPQSAATAAIIVAEFTCRNC